MHNTHAQQQQQKYPTRSYTMLTTFYMPLPYINYYGNNLLVYGSNHTTDANDPQVADICAKLVGFAPTVVLYEGDGIGLGSSMREAVTDYFEMGLVKYLADSLHIRAINTEPDTREKYCYLLQHFSIDEVMLATLGLQIGQLQRANADFRKICPKLLRDLVKEGLPLTKEQQTLAYFYKTYQQRFGRAFSYRTFDDTEIQAKYNRTVFNRVNQEANVFRDQHLLALTDSLLQQQEKVYIQVGGWHAIVCEPAFRRITAR